MSTGIQKVVVQLDSVGTLVQLAAIKDTDVHIGLRAKANILTVELSIGNVSVCHSFDVSLLHTARPNVLEDTIQALIKDLRAYIK